jgi:hypothetical protein
MSIVSYTELARTFENELGTPARAIRRWAVVLSDDTLAGNPLNTADIFSTITDITNFGTTAHPSHSALKFRKVTINERFGDSPYHVEVIAEYGTVTDQETLAPTARRADWVFESQPGQLAALRYYHGSTGNDDVRPLTNTAGDYFEGLTAEENMVRITIRKNFAAFPTTLMGLTNFLNNAEYATCAKHTLKCAGVNSDFTQEVWNNTEYSFWATEVVLQFRQSGWPLLIPDVGFNFLSGSQKRRAMVFDFQNSEWVASPGPVALDGAGGQSLGAFPAGQPSILTRRVNPDTNFAALLGVPPTAAGWPSGGL